MFKNLIAALALTFFSPLLIAQVEVNHLLTENRNNPVGLDTREPRFSWQLQSHSRNIMQTAYEIQVREGNKISWTSGKQASDQSVQVPYAGPPLKSGTRYFWKVRVWDKSGKSSAWSEDAFWQTGLFETGDWKATWIQPGYQEDSSQPSPSFRKEFNISKKIKTANLYITAHGLYEAAINGARVGDAYLSPGWTSYNKRLQYQVYDAASMLHPGKNAIGVTLGSGWYRGFIGFSGNKNYYGKDISLLCQLEIVYSDGSVDLVVSDNSWKSSTGAIRSSEIYNGETIDAREEKKGWTTPAYDDHAWSTVKVASFPMNNLIATYNEPIRKHETFKPVRFITTPKGEKVIDFGQNLVGWVIMKVKGKAGDKVILSTAEVLDKEGNFYTENLRAAKSTDDFILSGNGEETFEPHFTFHGFRYIRVEGYPGEMKEDDFTAVTLYSDMPKNGTFTSSNPMINQLQHNIQWGQRGNFLDVPTDCPQRDERLGWTGDAQVFSRTATFNMGVNDFFAKWLKDVAADQSKEGVVPFVIPNVLGFEVGSTGWADVCTIVPWNMYIAYGDKRILADQYPSMKEWVDYMHSKSKNDLWNTGFHFGDWLFYRPFDDNDGRSAVTDKYLIAQCFYAHSTQLVINAARVLGKTEDVSKYEDLLKKIKDAFLKEYMTPNGRLVSGTQTAYVLALTFDMLPESLRQEAEDRLVENVKSYDNHLTTGFLGSSYLTFALSRFGHEDLAFKLLMQDTYPSWLYPVKMGATTIWERWDGIKPDSTFEVPSMNSYNHYAYGAIGDWMYRVVAGLDTYEDGPGYRHIKIQPHTGGGFTMIAADLQTYYGKTGVHWKTENSRFDMDVDIPANTNADVYVPSAQPGDVMENGVALQSSNGMQVVGQEGSFTHLKLGSGTYHFSSKLPVITDHAMK